MTFNEDVNFSGTVSIACSSGTQDVTPTGGPRTFTLPHSNFAANDACGITIQASQIADTDTNDPPNTMAADYSWSFTVAASVATNIIINEMDADTLGTDVAEFIELYDGGAGNTSLTGLVVVLFNGNGDVSYAAFDLDGHSTDGNGYFVICGNAANVANCDWDVTPDSDLIQNGADAVALYTANSANFPNGTAITTVNLLDAVVYDTDDADDAGLLVLLNADEPQINEDGQNDSENQSSQRCPNGSGGARNTSSYNQAAPTPGVANVCSAGGSCSTIPEIQGSGNASTCLGYRSAIEGCITGVTADGFYFQDLIGDGNPDTSDGMYAYYSSTWANPSNLQPGDQVRVSGTVVEYYDNTEFTNPSVTDLGACASLPTPVSIPPVTDPTADPMILYERYEGMRVKMTFSGWVVGATKRFDSRYPVRDPEIAFVDFDSNIPDYSRVFERDYAGYRGINYLSGGFNFDLPNVDFGDGIAGTDITGVLGYQFDKYTLLVDASPTLSIEDNADVAYTAPALDSTKVEVDVCYFNVENLFDNVNDGTGDWGDWAPGYPTAGTAAGLAVYKDKLARVAGVIVNKLQSCMVIGVEEMEGKQQVYNDLAAALHTADANHTWTGIYVESGDSRDISQGFLYRNDVTLLSGPTLVSGSPYTDWVADSTLNFVRVPASATFRFHAGQPQQLDVILYAVHFKSKGNSASCSTPDCTDKRELEAADMRDILAHHQTEGEYAIAGGDYNDTFGSSPINILDASASIYSPYYDLDEAERWSYVFNGESEVLDHVYMTKNLLYATSGWNHAFNPVHVNADFPSAEHASDHDPLRLRLRLPSDYGSTPGYGQVWHLRLPGSTLQLGTAWTDDALFDSAADENDTGVTFGTFEAGKSAQITVNVQGTAASGRWLRFWFDWNKNGVFDSDERVFDQAVNAGSNTLTVAVPAGISTAIPYRARLYDAASMSGMGILEEDLGASGGTAGGEVEDGSSPVPTAVTLAAFGAAPQGEGILVTWETAAELQNLGFNLYRAESATGPWTKLNAELIPAQNPGAIFGASYEWLDTGVIPDTTYFYRLEDVDVNGASTFHGPVSATAVGVAAVGIVAFGARSPLAGLALALAAAAVLAVWRRRR